METNFNFKSNSNGPNLFSEMFLARKAALLLNACWKGITIYIFHAWLLFTVTAFQLTQDRQRYKLFNTMIVKNVLSKVLNTLSER